MESKKNIYRTIILILSILLLITILYFLPWLTRIDMDMKGTFITADGDISETVKVTVRGWKLDYLFQRDRIALEFTLPDEHSWQFTKYSNPTYRYESYLGVPYVVSDCTFYHKSENRSAFGGYALSVENELLIVEWYHDPMPYLVCSADPDRDPTEILEYFSVFINGGSQAE